jgi:hypothetical protein
MKPMFKKERIYRILLLKESLSFTEIVSECGVSKSYVSKVLSDLAKKEAITIGEKIYANPKVLLRDWSSYKRKIFEKIFPLKVDVLIPESIRSSLENYAVSGPFAESLVQGETPGIPVIVYVAEKDFIPVKEKVIKNFATGKGQVWIYPYDEYVFAGCTMLKGWKIASIPQICADIIALGTYADAGFMLFERWIDAGRRL